MDSYYEIENRCTSTMPDAVAALNNIKQICAGYGLYAKYIDYRNAHLYYERDAYFVVSIHPIENDINPYKIYLQRMRNPGIIFLDHFAFRVRNGDNSAIAFKEIMEYCKKNEFIRTLFAEFKTKLPECVRHSEYIALRDLNDGRFNTGMGATYQLECQKGVESFFKAENSKRKREQEERCYWRSDKCDADAKESQRRADFKSQKGIIVRKNILEQYTDSVKRVEVPEEYYDRFIRYLEEYFPEVTLSVDEKKVFDNGLIGLAKRLPKDHPSMKRRPVTSAEFSEILRRDFANKGWQVFEEYQSARWESRYVYYKEIDEPYIVLAYNSIFFEFAQHQDMSSLWAQGTCSMIHLETSQVYDFVVGAKKENILFHIDYRGRFAVPSLEKIHIVYNTRNQSRVNNIVEKMISRCATHSHLLYEQQVHYAPFLEV